MCDYVVKKINTKLVLDGNVSKPEWQSTNQSWIENYPWYEVGLKQETYFKVLHNNLYMYLLFFCEDKHIYAKVTELNGSVSEDSCVEFFAIPGRCKNYFNLEVNCCGTILMGYGPDRYHRRAIDKNMANQIRVYQSIKGKTKEESDSDTDWILEIEIPFSMLAEFTGIKIDDVSGKTWSANFYRCGGKTEPQFACWSPISAEKPDFHRPEYFSRIIFE